LLAIYEYTHNQSDDSFVAITSSARIAYAARINTRGGYQTKPAAISGLNGDIDDMLQIEEAANTWWVILIYERYFISKLFAFY
jgi:hypothetical protein